MEVYSALVIFFVLFTTFFRANGLGELYTYFPLVDQNTESLKKVPPRFVPNPNFGFSVGRGAFNWKKAVGNWTAVACRIKLNDIGCANGSADYSIFYPMFAD